MYVTIQAKRLPCYAVPQLYLKEYTTSKSERKKGILKIPASKFRLPDDLTAGSQTVSQDEGGPDNFEYNKSRSKTIYQPASSGKSIQLADFKLVKKLGQGQYGAVRFGWDIRRSFWLRSSRMGCCTP